MSWFSKEPKHLKSEMTARERAESNRDTVREFKDGRGDAKDDIERNQTPYSHWSKNNKPKWFNQSEDK